MTLCNARVGKIRRVNKETKLCGRRIAWFFTQKYAAKLKVLEGFNLRIDITGYIQMIAAFLTIERLANIRK